MLLENSTLFEKKQKMHQIFYTPLRLHQVFKEAGFMRDRMEICFFDSERMMEETERYYKLPKVSGLCIWELLVLYRK